MVAVHLVVGCSVILLNLLGGTVGGIAWFRDRGSVPFWYLLRAAQASVFLQVMLGGLLVFTNHEAPDSLHYLYGLLPLLVSFLAEAPAPAPPSASSARPTSSPSTPTPRNRSPCRSSAARWES